MRVCFRNPRLFFLLVLIISAVVFCMGCSDDDDPVTPPASPKYSLISETPLPATGRKGTVESGNMYIACSDSGLVVMDVSDPAAPNKISRLHLDEMAYHVTILGPTAFVTTSHAGSYYSVNIADPGTPGILDSYAFQAGQGQRSCVRAGLALTANTDGVEIIDITNPNDLNALGTVPGVTGSYDVRFCPGNMTADLAVATDGSTLTSFTVTNAGVVAQLDQLTLPDLIYGIWVEGNLVFVANRNQGLQVVQFDDDGDMTLLSSIDLPGGNARDVVVSDGRAYVASSDGDALYVVNVASPADPKLIWQYEHDEGAKGLAVDGSFVYLLQGDQLTILKKDS